MCDRLYRFAQIPALSTAGRRLRVEQRSPRDREDWRAGVQARNNICPTDYSDVMTMAMGGEVMTQQIVVRISIGKMSLR
jgi:hypothetical protein